MTANSNEQFYSSLSSHKIALPALLSDESLFSPVPADWHVIITDIKGSTTAVLGGSHQDVNLISTGSIVTVLNIAYSMDITVPFFFGGDGATFIVPPILIDRLMEALALYRVNTYDNFKLELRTGTVPVADIYTKEHNIKIAKFSSSKNFTIPIVLGSGLDYAEKLIKAEDYLFSRHTPKIKELDLTGMQCRWDTIPPPKNKEEVVTLLIISRNIEKQSAVFGRVLEKMDELYGTQEMRQPISIARLKLKTTFSRLTLEMQVQLGKIKWFELFKNWIVTFSWYLYFSTNKGKTYLKSMVEMSDTLVIDGKINTVITGTVAQRASLQKLLDEMEKAGEILYGIHISEASIMSCYVRNLVDDHIHFVDGSDGGYTKAAKVMKEKLKKGYL
ncbi:DUF3095 domain-containing protein [Flavobacterium hauense]